MVLGPWSVGIMLGLVAGQAASRAERANECDQSIPSPRSGWSALLDHARRCRDVDDGGLAEGYSEVVIRLLADHWKELPALARAVHADPEQEEWVFRHVDPTVLGSDLERVEANAEKECPGGHRRLCQRIARASRCALAHLRETGMTDVILAIDGWEALHAHWSRRGATGECFAREHASLVGKLFAEDWDRLGAYVSIAKRDPAFGAWVRQRFREQAVPDQAIAVAANARWNCPRQYPKTCAWLGREAATALVRRGLAHGPKAASPCKEGEAALRGLRSGPEPSGGPGADRASALYATYGAHRAAVAACPRAAALWAEAVQAALLEPHCLGRALDLANTDAGFGSLLMAGLDHPGSAETIRELRRAAAHACDERHAGWCRRIVEKCDSALHRRRQSGGDGTPP